MATPITPAVAAKRGAEDAGRYFRYMAQFVGFTEADAEVIAQTRPIIEKHLPGIVADFYDQLLRYPPTRKVFLKADGTIDQEYVEKRMLFQTNFWLRSASGVYDDDYASYIDYVGRAHTSHGADPNIYVAERYVIGMVGFMQRAIDQALDSELHDADHNLEDRAEAAWGRLLMVILEMLSRAYGNERAAETFEPLMTVDGAMIAQLAEEAFEEAEGKSAALPSRDVIVGLIDDIEEGDRRIVQIGALSVGVFHHKGSWYAVENHCLHRGGPVATGRLDGDVLTCPWHGFQYNVTTGQLLVDPNAVLRTFPVTIQNGEIHLQVPETVGAADGVGIGGQSSNAAPAGENGTSAMASATPAAPTGKAPASGGGTIDRPPKLQANEFRPGDLEPGDVIKVDVGGQEVAVYDVDGNFYATQAHCTHQGGPLNEGEMDGRIVTCPWHGSRFDVSTGAVVRGPARDPLKTYRVVIEGDVARVEAGG
jgi:nitrite reductase/ring-hydroxylating ferredoxin subunit